MTENSSRDKALSGSVIPELRGYGPSVSLEEASEILGVKTQTMRGMATKAEIPAFKVGRQWRIRTLVIQRIMLGQDPWTDQPPTG